MTTTITKYQCDQCKDGTIKKIVKETKKAITIDFKKCDCCGNFRGLKGVESLAIKQ